MNAALEKFQHRMLEFDKPEILCTGMKQWEGSPVADYTKAAPHGVWVNTDIEQGDEVDLVGDLQTMWETIKDRFEGIFSQATLEHIERPWVAVHSMAAMLKPSGLLYLNTHQTFPIHGYPNDYFRFSDESLKTMARDSGLVVLEAGYSHPCVINPPPSVKRWNPLAHAYLNVWLLAEKPGE